MPLDTMYLTTAGESTVITEPRTCRFVRRMRHEDRDDFMLVTIEPPLIGQKYGLGGEDIDMVILGTRHQGFTLFPVTEWPSHVYVLRALDNSVLTADEFQRDQIEIIAWAFLFNDQKAVNEYVRTNIM